MPVLNCRHGQGGVETEGRHRASLSSRRRKPFGKAADPSASSTATTSRSAENLSDSSALLDVCLYNLGIRDIICVFCNFTK